MKGQPRIPIRSTSALAKALGLSRWTVSRSLNSGGGVSQETVRRVKEAARQHGFRPSTLARGLRSGQTDVVGICLPDPEAFFLGGKLGQLLTSIFEQGLEPLMQVTDGTIASEERALGRFAAMRCAKVVTFALRLGNNDPVLRALEAAGTRAIHVDPIGGVSGMRVVADRAEAMVLAVRHLHDRGHRSFCLAGLGEGSAYAGQRHRGLRRAARDLGLEKEQDFQILGGAPGVDDFEAGKQLALAWLALGRRRPRGIIALNDRMAFAMMATLRGHGVFAPQDFAIVGYDATALGLFCEPRLTTIDPRHELLIQKTVEHLGDENTKRPRTVRISPALIERGSA